MVPLNQFRVWGGAGLEPFMMRSFTVRSSEVVSEVLEGEAVIMDLRSGHYFSARDVACTIWQMVAAGRSYGAILNGIQAVFDVGDAVLLPQLDRFIEALLAHDLIRLRVDGEAPPTAANGLDAAAYGSIRRPFTPPTLDVYTDMEDLLLLDPIHDVDDIGWPTRKPMAGPH
jgi:hypothetical protein